MPLGSRIKVIIVLGWLSAVWAGQKELELAHLGLKVVGLGRAVSLFENYRLIKTVDLRNLERPVKLSLACELYGNKTFGPNDRIKTLCDQLVQEVNSIESIFNGHSQIRGRRGVLSGFFKATGRGLKRLVNIKRSGIRYQRLYNPGEVVGASKGSRVKKFLYTAAAGAGGSAAYDVVSASSIREIACARERC